MGMWGEEFPLTRVNRDGSAVGGWYTMAEVLIALQSHRVEVFRHELWRWHPEIGPSGAWTFQEDITQKVVSCVIHYDAEAQNSMRTADYEIRDDNNTIHWLADTFKTYHLIQMPDGYYVQFIKCNVYVPSPKQMLAFGATRKVQACDSLRVLYENKITDWFSVPSAAAPYPFGDINNNGNPVQWANQLLLDTFPSGGFVIDGDTDVRLDHDNASASDPPSVYSHHRKIYVNGTSLLDIINNLLFVQAGFDIIRARADGLLKSQPRVKPSSRPVDITYVAGGTISPGPYVYTNETGYVMSASLIVEGESEAEQDLWNAPNRWIRNHTRPDAEPLRASRFVGDPQDIKDNGNAYLLNPLWKGNRAGIEVVDYADTEASRQDEVDTICDYAFENGQRVLRKLTVKVPLMPHDHMDKVAFQWAAQHPWATDQNRQFILYRWTFPCEPGGLMTLEFELSPFSPALTAAKSGTMTASSQAYTGGYSSYLGTIAAVTSAARVYVKARARMIARSYKNVSTRARLTSRAYADIASRVRLTSRVTLKDVRARFRLLWAFFANAKARSRIVPVEWGGDALAPLILSGSVGPGDANTADKSAVFDVLIPESVASFTVQALNPNPAGQVANFANFFLFMPPQTRYAWVGERSWNDLWTNSSYWDTGVIPGYLSTNEDLDAGIYWLRPDEEGDGVSLRRGPWGTWTIVVAPYSMTDTVLFDIIVKFKTGGTHSRFSLRNRWQVPTRFTLVPRPKNIQTRFRLRK